MTFDDTAIGPGGFYHAPYSLSNSNREIRAFEPQLRELASRFGELRCPVLVVHGTRDGLVPYANTDFVRREAGGPVELVTLEGDGHLFIWSDGDRVRRDLEAFLEGLTAAEDEPR